MSVLEQMATELTQRYALLKAYDRVQEEMPPPAASTEAEMLEERQRMVESATSLPGPTYVAAMRPRL